MTTIKQCIAIVPLALALAACSSGEGKVDLGDDATGSTAQGLAAYEGSWDGYAEAREFDGGSDRVRITLDAEGQGTIQFGDAPTMPAFTDPDVGYPTDWQFDSAHYTDRAHMLAHEGFGYPVHDAVVSSGRLSFGFWGTDLAKDWCEAHEPLPDYSQPVGYTCTPAGYGENDGVCYSGITPETQAEVECGLMRTCLNACECDANSCTSERREGEKMQLDGALTADGDSLVGTLLLVPANEGYSATERVTVRLSR